MRLESSRTRPGRRTGLLTALAAVLLLVAAPALATTVKSISLKDTDTGTQVIVEGDAPINYHDFTLESPDRIVLDCPGTTLAFSERTWAGRDNSPVKSVRATEMGWGKDTGSRIVVDLASATSYGVSAVGNNVVLAVETPAEPKAPAAASDAAPERPSASDNSDGRRMSLDVQNADIETVLRSLSEYSGRNIVASKDVKGQCTLRLRNVTWRHALNILMDTQGLGMVESGQTIVVSTADLLRKEALERNTAARAQEDLLPLETRIVPVSYANSAEMAKSVEKTLTKRGHIEVDSRTNSLVVTDIEERLDQAESMIRSLDTRTPQVEIVARLVDVDVTATRQLGIEWNATNLNLFDAGARTNVNVNPGTVPNPAGQVQVGKVYGWGALDATLTALETQNKANIISNPRITTVNNREASVIVGQQIPLIVQDFAGNSVTQLTTIGIKLNVTPHVNVGNKITMDVHPEVSDLSSQATVQGGIIINTTMADTRVMVNDGETAVIGGLIRSVESHTNRGVPVLMDMPIIGSLFKTTSTTHAKRELLIFLTPKILNETTASAN
jgi:type IV pilus assembly protein PilQ